MDIRTNGKPYFTGYRPMSKWFRLPSDSDALADKVLSKVFPELHKPEPSILSKVLGGKRNGH